MNDATVKFSYSSIVLTNDEKTDFDFVVQVLRHVLGKPELEAVQIARLAGWMGRYSCGTYPSPVAEAFVSEAARYAAARGSSLRLTLEVLKTLSLVEEIRVVRYGCAA